jgi:O-antigen/teichoic acid export membrane protein
MLKFGIPMLPSGLSNYILRQSDRWFLQHYTTLSVVGVYSLGYKIGETINLFFVQPFELVWLPLAFEMETRPDARRFYEKMLTYVVLVSFWMVLGLSLFGRELLILMTSPGYYGAYTVIPWTALSYAVYSCYFVVNIGILMKNKTSYAVWIVGASALSNIIFNLLLIPSLGSIGAAQATFFSYLILFGIAWWMNRRVFPLNYEWPRILKVIFVFLGLLVGGYFVSGGILVSVILKSLLILAYWPTLMILRFYSKDELSWAKATVQRYIFQRPARE